MTSLISPTHLKIVSEFFLKGALREPSTLTEICDQTKLPENIVLEALNLFKRYRLLIQKNDLWNYNESMILAFCKVTEFETDIQKFIDNPERETSPFRQFYLVINDPPIIKGVIYDMSLVKINWNLSEQRVDQILKNLEQEGTIQRQSKTFTILKPDRLKELENDFYQKTDQELRNNNGLHERFRQEDMRKSLSPLGLGPPPPRSSQSSQMFGTSNATTKSLLHLADLASSPAFDVDSDESIRSVKRISRILTNKRRKEKTLHVRISKKMALEFEQLCIKRDLSTSEVTRQLIKGFINNQNKAAS